MRRPLWLGLLTLAACQSAEPTGSSPGSSTSEPASAPAARPTALAHTAHRAPELALVATQPGSRQSDVLFVRDGEAPRVVARLSHLPDAEVKATLSGRTVLAIADVDATGDGSFGAALQRIDERQEPVLLADRCVHASRPWATGAGQVLVQRGRAGPEPQARSSGAGLRVDALSIDAIEIATGHARELTSFSGYITHIAGLWRHHAIVYRVTTGHADLVALDLSSGELRVLVPEVAPFARDFAIDDVEGELYFTNRDDRGWMIERLPLSGGARRIAARARGPWAKPAPWPGGGLLVNDGEGGEVRGGPGPRRALGRGFDALGLVSRDQRWAVLIHESPGTFATPYWVELSSSSLRPIVIPGNRRIALAGELP
jgi:hypothetical protein